MSLLCDILEPQLEDPEATEESPENAHHLSKWYLLPSQHQHTQACGQGLLIAWTRDPREVPERKQELDRICTSHEQALEFVGYHSAKPAQLQQSSSQPPLAH